MDSGNIFCGSERCNRRLDTELSGRGGVRG